MLELEALDETTKEDNRLSEAREQIMKLESEIKKFSLYFLSLESNKKSPKPKIEIRGLSMFY
jgi:hypothetical protein